MTEKGRGPDRELIDQFIEDYFAESEEHLTAIREALLSLEAFIHKARTDTALLKDLLLHFHSLKGLSAMVALSEAEDLSHTIETYLRALMDEKVILTAEAVDTVIAGTNLLEEIIAARRNKWEIPGIELVTARFRVLLPDRPASPGALSGRAAEPAHGEDDAEPAQGAGADLPEESITDSRPLWQCIFTPSQALADSGMNVNTVRERLKAIGELVRAAPRVAADGGISFEFIVATESDPEVFRGWRNDGITSRPYGEGLGNGGEDGETTFPDTVTRPAPPHQAVSASGFVRVDLSRLDDLMRMIGDLVISRARLQDRIGGLCKVLPIKEVRPLEEINLAIERQLRELREGVMRVRLVPIGEIFQRMKFVVRDLSKEMGKRVSLRLEGEETEIDKFVVERMMDPLLHLVRNAVSHGLETESERLAKGKPAEGELALKASTAGNSVVIIVQDDGQGIDVDRVMEKARALNLIEADAKVDQAALLGILCSPGFSTREEADRASGRGVGMTVVRNAVTELGGAMRFETFEEGGTRFTIQLPLTLAIVDALIVMSGGHTFAVPQTSVSEILEVTPERITTLENNELVPYRDGVLPLVRLSRVFGIGEMWSNACYALVSGEGTGLAGIVVDRLMGQREIVVRAITEKLVQVPGVAGATELGDGRAVLILDVNALAGMERSRSRPVGQGTMNN